MMAPVSSESPCTLVPNQALSLCLVFVVMVYESLEAFLVSVPWAGDTADVLPPVLALLEANKVKVPDSILDVEVYVADSMGAAPS